MSKFHLTIHLGTHKRLSDDVHQGKTHIVHKIKGEKKLDESVNMYPFNFTRTKTGLETDNNIGPDTCMQVIPIFPLGAADKDIKISIATILNTFLYNLQIKQHSDTLWEKTKQTSQIDDKFKNYKISLKVKSNRIKRRLRIQKLTDFIPKAIIIIEKMSEFFSMLLENYKHCIEHIKGILIRCKNFLTNLTDLLPKQIYIISSTDDLDGNNEHINDFNTAIETETQLKKLTELIVSTNEVPDIDEISNKIQIALSNLKNVEDQVEGDFGNEKKTGESSGAVTEESSLTPIGQLVGRSGKQKARGRRKKTNKRKYK
jgi:hypothetical protein